MKTRQLHTQPAQKKGKNYEAAKIYLEEIFHELGTDLENRFSDLQTSKPFLVLEDAPPRISLSFTSKTNGLPGMNSQMEKELKAKQSKISQIVKQIANRYDLSASPGQFGRYEKRRGLHETRRAYGLGLYTFLPKYKNFKK